MDSPLSQLLKNFKDTRLRTEMISASEIKTFKAYEVISEENTINNNLYIVITGCLKATKSYGDNKDFHLYYVKQSEACGGISFSQIEQATKVKLEAECNTEVLIFSGTVVLEWFKKYPVWAEYIMMQYQMRFAQLLDDYQRNITENHEKRVLDFLKAKSCINNNNKLRITHQAIADELGTAREVISRLLKKMEKENKVALHRSHITLN